MRSRIDIKVRLAAHILAVVIIIVIWSSVVPRQSFNSSRFAEGEAQPVPTETIAVPDWTQPAPVVDSVAVVADPVLLPTPPTSDEPALLPLPVEQAELEQSEPPVESIASEPELPVVEEQPSVTREDHSTPSDSTEQAPEIPVEIPTEEPTPVVTEERPPLLTSQETDETEAAEQAEEPISPEMVTQEIVDPETFGLTTDMQPVMEEDESLPEQDATPSTEQSTTSNEITDIQIDPSDSVTEPAPDSPVGEDVQSGAVSDLDPVRPQPDESGALAVADSQLPEKASLPLPEIAGLEYYADGLYWLVVSDAADDRLDLLPQDTTLLFIYGNKESLPNGTLLNTQLFLADDSELTDDGAEHFLRVVQDLRGRPAGLAAAVVLPDYNASAFYKGVYLLARQTMGFDAMLTAIEPELKLAGDMRDGIVHRLRRLDVTPLVHFVK